MVNKKNIRFPWATRALQKKLAPFSLLRSERLAGVSGAVVLSLLASGADATDWKIIPRLGIKETYTDNVGLATAGNEKSEFITQINPGISLSGKGGRVSAQVDYTLQNIIYARDSKNNTSNHQLAANGNAELVEHSLFVDALAAIRQQNISLLAPLGVENTSTTGNLATVTTYSVSPYWRHTFGTTASTELRYGHDEAHYDVDRLSDSKNDRVNFSLNSGPAFSSAFWGLNYADNRIKYQDRPDYETTTASGNLGYRLTPKFKVYGKRGHEEYGYQTSNKPSYSFWNVGFGWAPTTRTDLDASYGERFFGKTYSLNFTHRTRLTAWNMSYNQDVMTTAQQLAMTQLFFLGRTSRFLVFARDNQTLFTNRVFLDKRFQASVTINSGKSVVLLSAFNSLRESLESDTIDSRLLGSRDFLAGDKIRQYGVMAGWNWQMSPHTSSNLSGNWSRVLQPASGREDDLWYVWLSLVRQFQPKLHGSLELRHQQRDSNKAAGDYKENAVTAAVNMTF
ncbi:MAG: TIGR03016 family PEP-CTERM system-associated outer membrane protein [Pseudomonadota bacterium]